MDRSALVMMNTVSGRVSSALRMREGVVAVSVEVIEGGASAREIAEAS